MPTLQEKLQSSEILYFADPIHFGGQYCENRMPVILKSDFDFFKPYIRNWSKRDSKFRKEIMGLDEFSRNKIRWFDGSYSITIPDSIKDNAQKLDKFFKTQDFLSGPQVDYSTGKYKKFSGDDSERLDIFGQKVEVADFRFFSHNHLWIGDNKIYIRTISLEAEQEGIYENISIFQKKSKYILIADYEENDSLADSYNYFDGGELDIESGIVFVEDLEDNEEIEEALMEWHEEYLSDLSEWVYSEEKFPKKVKYKNPIKISSSAEN